MSSKSNETKSNQLGIPHGTAQGKLRKSIMFMLVKECGRDNCFKCSKKIETPEELSVEHKEPWLHNDTSLFWDLNNIAFSHLKCNKADRRPPGNRENLEEGFGWCCNCKKAKQISMFYKNTGNKLGIQTECIECRSEKKKSRTY